MRLQLLFLACLGPLSAAAAATASETWRPTAIVRSKTVCDKIIPTSRGKCKGKHCAPHSHFKYEMSTTCSVVPYTTTVDAEGMETTVHRKRGLGTAPTAISSPRPVSAVDALHRQETTAASTPTTLQTTPRPSSHPPGVVEVPIPRYQPSRSIGDVQPLVFTGHVLDEGAIVDDEGVGASSGFHERGCCYIRRARGGFATAGGSV